MVNINSEIGREFLTETQLVANIQRQTEKEKLCVTSGMENYYNLLEKARLRKNLENLKPEQRIIKHTVAPLAAMLRSALGTRVGGTRLYIVTQAKDYLRRLPIEEIAFLTLSLLIEVPKDNSCTVQSLAIELGEHILQQINMKKFTSELPGLAQAIEESIKLYDRRMKNKVRTANFKKQTDYEAITVTDRELLYRIGIIPISCVLELGLFKLEYGVNSSYLNRRRTLIPGVVTVKKQGEKVTIPLQDYLSECHYTEALWSVQAPHMLIPPLRYTEGNLYTGGYLTNFGTQRRPMIRFRNNASESTYLKKCSTMKRAVDALNIIQETPWRINTRVLDVLKTMAQSPRGRAGLPDQDKTLLLGEYHKPWANDEDFLTFKNKENQEAYRKLRPYIENFNNDDWEASVPLDLIHLLPQTRKYVAFLRYCFNVNKAQKNWAINTSKREALRSRIQKAEELQEEPAFWIPHFFDWRYRVYPAPAFLNEQAEDSGKALLEFAKGEPLDSQEAVDWFLIQGANKYGEDKLPFNKRIDWVKENHKRILETARNPLDYEWWMEADKPFQFLAWSFEYADWCENKQAFVSRQPIAQDGSCNSYQHYAAILKDDHAGSLVNLVPAEKPQDIYMEVCYNVREKNHKIATDTEGVYSEDDFKCAQAWEGKIERFITKRGTMTKVYGVSGWGIGNQLITELEQWEQKHRQPYLNGYDNKKKACTYMAQLIDEAIAEVIQSATDAMKFLQDVSDLVCAQGLPEICWTTPVGTQVVQRYPKQHKKKIKTCFGSSNIQLSLKTDIEDSVDSKSMRQAVSPCFVHSMDASMMLETVKRLNEEEGITCFATVHDSYAVHARYAGKLARTLREVFIEHYDKGNPLVKFQSEVNEQVKLHIYREGLKVGKSMETLGQEVEEFEDCLPSIPEEGTLDVRKVSDSQYFFA
jgi:DNA-directed RNA polymerase